MATRTSRLAFLASLCIALSGCDWMPGRPNEAQRWKPPTTVTDFKVLYTLNCTGCHSDTNAPSPSISLNNPLYLSIIPRDTMHKIIVEGVTGKLMPGFVANTGTGLTEQQVNALLDGIYAWGKGSDAGHENLPPYSAPLGDAQKGQTSYGTYCASCHGDGGKGGKVKGSIVDPSYLRLVSDQYLRTIVIAGRQEIGMPNFKDYVPGKPMSPEEISDVVAWLSSQRPSLPATMMPQVTSNSVKQPNSIEVQ
ncbi:MAG: c-type cytochrome [Ktedonobacteraceae bacterium]|nr:c-type cytochrome [Ktedonobacteraceae bacterium]